MDCIHHQDGHHTTLWRKYLPSHYSWWHWLCGHPSHSHLYLGFLNFETPCVEDVKILNMNTFDTSWYFTTQSETRTCVWFTNHTSDNNIRARSSIRNAIFIWTTLKITSPSWCNSPQCRHLNVNLYKCHIVRERGYTELNPNIAAVEELYLSQLINKLANSLWFAILT